MTYHRKPCLAATIAKHEPSVQVHLCLVSRLGAQELSDTDRSAVDREVSSMRAALEYYFRNDCTEGGGTIQSTLDQLETILTQAIVGVARALHIHDIDMPRTAVQIEAPAN